MMACSVYSLSWDSVAQELYIGGNFDLLGTESISPGIAIWSNRNGLRGFPCTVDGDCAAGLRGSSAHVTGIAISVAFDHSSEVMGLECSTFIFTGCIFV